MVYNHVIPTRSSKEKNEKTPIVIIVSEAVFDCFLLISQIGVS